jgi:hypothetical protein
MEPVRPRVDAYLLDWIRREALKREWFFEKRDGNCRLMGSFAMRLSETAPTWGRAVAPFAEWVAHALWSKSARSRRELPPATRLTQVRKREAKGSTVLPANPVPRPLGICRVCGTSVARGKSYCALCVRIVSKENLVRVAMAGRVSAQSPEAPSTPSENAAPS